MPELKPHAYEHQPPRRLTPPPLHPAPPNLKVFAWVGLGLGVVILVLALLYLVGYLMALAGL